jgi:hypothetical protein
MGISGEDMRGALKERERGRVHSRVHSRRILLRFAHPPMSAPIKLTRRDFLRTTAGALALPAVAAAAPPAGEAFSFVLLGDLHYDKLEHHDMAWLDKNKAGDLSQIRNYSRITADITPKLLATARESVAEARAAFVLQVGDLVEGLCGTAELAARQNLEALAFVESMQLGVPFLFTKGNHDVTGDGAPEAFQKVFHPYLSRQSGGKLEGACYTLEHGDALFCFFDAYDKASLDWLEAALARRTARHCFVLIHPPVVPYGARATWHLYSSERDRSRREKLLTLLGQQNAFVLGGHIHKYSTLTRTTPAGGRFVQVAVSSIVNALDVQPKDQLSGLAEYNGDQIRVEPRHSPETEKERRAVYEAEKPFVTTFAYADLPGHAVISVDGARVAAKIYSGVSRQLWKEVDLVKAMDGSL